MRFLATLFTLLSLQSLAATPTTDFSDLWYNPNEEGWGVTLTQQNDILFVTLYVYGADGKPKWYVGPATRYVGSVNGKLTFTGPLYETTGPYFAAPVFDEGQVVVIPAGEVTFASAEVARGTLTYKVGTQTVIKNVERQAWAYENLSGVYVGASLGGYVGCGSNDGYFESPATITVTHNGSSITLKELGVNYTCDYAGTYYQRGRFGEISATGTCTANGQAQFVGLEVLGGITGLSMRYGVQFAGSCRGVGRMGGVRRGLDGL